MAANSPSPFDLAKDPIARRVTTALAKIGLALKNQAWQEGGARGLTPTQGQILSLLNARSGTAGPSRLSTVAARLGVSAGTASEAVAALVRKGLVQKTAAMDDARAVALDLTREGRREASRVAGWPDFLLRAVEELSADEQAVFLRGLVKMIRALQDKGQIPVARMCVSCRFFRPNVHDSALRPHHCAFVDAPFGDAHVRLDCPDFEEEVAM